jgi:hypothetical protein
MLLAPPWNGRSVAPSTVALETSTPGTYNVTVPPGVFKARARLVGAGGGGGGFWNAGDAWSGNGGGSGGYYWDEDIDVYPGQVLEVIVGAGGIGGSGLSTGTWICLTSLGTTFIGTAGGSTQITGKLTATGGKPGGNQVAGAIPANQSEGGSPNGVGGVVAVANCLSRLAGGDNGKGYGIGGDGGWCGPSTCGQTGGNGYARVIWP